MKIACITGHKFTYTTDALGQCLGKCTRCGKVISAKHNYQPTDNPCVLKCARCGHTKEKEHNYRRVPGKCVEVCAICGKENTWSAPAHTWKRIEGQCRERCTVCGEERKSGHTWKQVEGTCIPVCAICGEKGEFWNAIHTWQPVPGKCEEKCIYCDETRPMNHEYKSGKCVRCGRSVEEPESGSIPPLLWAAAEGDVAEVRALIAGGANVNRYGPDETPLIAAASRGYDAAHKEIVKLLLDAGANINATDIYGRTALQSAARKGLNDMVSFLASRGGR